MSITLDQITKRYQGNSVVNDVSLDVGNGEFFVLLGPSGSGKSTLLRAIAGLTGVDHGRISLHGRDVTHLSPRQREVGFVFQNYALFRHMSVADNIEFALRVRRVKAAERKTRRQELLRLVALEGMDERLPTQLSGGQQQRVAVARALAHKPDVLLMDEPFGALDAKIREELRRTIRQVQRELGITTILVTHDQEEAFALADRIGVMNLGRLLEVGRPDELYARPATRFVATFLGAANLLLARRTAEGIRVGATAVNARAGERLQAEREHEVVAVLRPEEIELAQHRDTLGANYIGHGVVESNVFTGALERMKVRITSGEALTQSNAPQAGDLATLEVTRTQHEQRLFPVRIGQSVVVGVRRIHVLPTPLSSFVVHGAGEEQAEQLRRHPLLAELANRMKTRVTMQVDPALNSSVVPLSTAAAPGGVAVLGAGPQVLPQIVSLLERGTTEVLVLPPQAQLPQRVLIHWSAEDARRGTLAVAASMLRHVSAEAVYVGILPEETASTQRAEGVRDLLDARSEAQAVHGLDMRTELRFGEGAHELGRQLQEAPDQMLILGVSDLVELRESFAALLSAQASWPMLIVYRPVVSIPADRRRRA